MKRILCLIGFLLTLLPAKGEARQGFTIGLGPVGNIFLIDTQPIVDPGAGGYVFFNYRFQEQFSFETSFLITSQDGTGRNQGDSGILFLAMPTFDLKYYLLTQDPRWDPFLGIGLGLYWVTEGRNENATGGVGLGSQVTIGFDYYLTEMISAGFAGVFRSVPLITDLGTPNLSTAVFPYSLMANIAFHF